MTCLAGCGDDVVHRASTASSTAPPTTTAGAPKPVEYGLVAGRGPLDRLAESGLAAAERRFGVRGRVVHGDPATALASLAAERPRLVIAVGRAMAPAVDAVAARFPDTNFAIVDVSQQALARRPPNVEGIVFKDEEGAFLAGYLAGLVTRQESGPVQTIGAVGGKRLPAIQRAISAYRAGARVANRRVEVAIAYSQTFTDPAKCKELALAQIANGSAVEFAPARACGLGTLEAARERNVWAIASGYDASGLGPFVLGSSVKKADVAVLEVMRSVEEGRFATGQDVVFDVASGGVGLGRFSARAPAEVVTRSKALEQRLAAPRDGARPLP